MKPVKFPSRNQAHPRSKPVKSPLKTGNPGPTQKPAKFPHQLVKLSRNLHLRFCHSVALAWPLKPCGNVRTCAHPLPWKPAHAFRQGGQLEAFTMMGNPSALNPKPLPDSQWPGCRAVDLLMDQRHRKPRARFGSREIKPIAGTSQERPTLLCVVPRMPHRPNVPQKVWLSNSNGLANTSSLVNVKTGLVRKHGTR